LAELNSNNVSTTKFRDNIHKQLLLRNLIDRVSAGVVVSDDDKQAYYDELVQSGMELPPREEIDSNLEYDIRQRQVSELLVPLITQLREAAEISIKISKYDIIAAYG
jgi:hypothetical protein